MKLSTIDSLNKLRYNFLKRLTIGWIFGFGGFILKDFIVNQIALGIILFVVLLGWLLFSITLFSFVKLEKKIQENKGIKHALYHKSILYNRYNSIAVGFWTLLILISGFLAFSFFVNISTTVVCELILYIGIASTLISSLIFNR